MIFTDRIHAGRELAAALADYSIREEVLNDRVVVLALPRGGVPVAAEIADNLTYLNQDVINTVRVSQAQIDSVIEREQTELARRDRVYRQGQPPLELEGRIVILVDDGLATGATMQVAVSALRSAGVAQIAAAVPVGAPDSCEALRAQVDELVCLHEPEGFGGVGRWYRNFDQVTDAQVIDLLNQHRGGLHEQGTESYH